MPDPIVYGRFPAPPPIEFGRWSFNLRPDFYASSAIGNSADTQALIPIFDMPGLLRGTRSRITLAVDGVTSATSLRAKTGIRQEVPPRYAGDP